MVTTMIRRDTSAVQLADVALGNLGAKIHLYGYDGVEKDPVLNTTTSTGNYNAVIHTTHGNDLAVPLVATAKGTVPTAANSVLLVQDAGLSVGVGKYVRLYDAVGTDYAELVADADGGLALGGSGTSAGLLTLSALSTPSILGLPWSTFAPGVTQSAALTMTVNWARWRIIGKLAIVQIKMTYSSGASVAGNNITITGIPALIQPARTGAFAVCGTMVFLDSSANLPYVGFAEASTTTTIIGYRDGATAVGAFGVDPAVAMAAGDVVAVALMYEVA